MSVSTWLFLAALVAVLYAAVIFIPPWVDNLSVKEAVEVAFTKGYFTADERLAEVVLNRVNTGQNAVGYHFEENDDGQRVEVPGLGLTTDNVTVFRDEATKGIRITVDYVREVRFKPFQKVKPVHFHVEKEQSFQ